MMRHFQALGQVAPSAEWGSPNEEVHKQKLSTKCQQCRAFYNSSSDDSSTSFLLRLPDFLPRAGKRFVSCQGGKRCNSGPPTANANSARNANI